MYIWILLIVAVIFSASTFIYFYSKSSPSSEGCDEIVDRCGVCGGDNACVGCDDVLNSGKVVDRCGVCGGDNACVGCDDVIDSGKVVDECGVCGGDNSTCSDCSGVPNGTKTVDRCGVCGGTDACVGCDDIPYSGKVKDSCGICGGDGLNCKKLCNVLVKSNHNSYQRDGDVSLTQFKKVVDTKYRVIELDLITSGNEVSHNNPFDPDTPMPTNDFLEIIANDGWKSTDLPLFLAIDFKNDRNAATFNNVYTKLQTYFGSRLMSSNAKRLADTKIENIRNKLVILVGEGDTELFSTTNNLRNIAYRMVKSGTYINQDYVFNRPSPDGMPSKNFTQTNCNLVRVYPSSTWGSDDNYYEVNPWMNAGAQMIAINDYADRYLEHKPQNDAYRALFNSNQGIIPYPS